MDDDPKSKPAQEQGWPSLPVDLLHDILARLPWSSHPSVAATCSHWRTAVSPFYPAWLTPLLLNAVDAGSTNVRYYSPYHHKSFEVAETLDTPDARICSANGHHLTLCHRAHDNKLVVVHANLVTGVIHDFYLLERTSFDFVVYDGDRTMFVVDAVGMLQVARVIQRDGDWYYRWEFSKLSPEEPSLTVSAMTNPVLHRGLLYLLGVDGRLAVHDDRRHEEGFQVLDKPDGFVFECDDDDDDFYLFESNEGDLMAMVMGRRGSPMRILKLDEEKMEWEKVDSLEGRALFTGTHTTMMVKTDVKWMQNKVFLPRLYDWPEIVHVDLVDQGGELAFVPESNMVSQDGGACGKNIWNCGLGHEEPKEFWETINVDYRIWVNFKN